MEALTFKTATAPGYFDFSSSQSIKTKQVSDAFNNLFNFIADKENLFTDVFTNWMNRDYSEVTIARTPFLMYQLQQCGMAWFRGNESQAARLASFILGGFAENTITNIVSIFTFLASSPFLWCTLNTLQLIFGVQVPAVLSETLIIYSDAGTPPSTPAPSAYVERDWEAPSGWTKTSGSSTYVSYGTLSGATITWSEAFDVTTVAYHFASEATGTPPGNPGDIIIVNTGGSDDTTASYFKTSSNTWGKFSTNYTKQGLVSDGVPSDPSQSVVAAPDQSTVPYAVSSNEAPPVTGLSKGYGIYAGFSDTVIATGSIYIKINLTLAGTQNLSVFINLLRRIKPTLNRLYFIYTYSGSTTTIEVHDTGELI